MIKALELADRLEKLTASGLWYDGKPAAAELRRLAAVEAERDALKAKLDICLRYAQGEAEDPALLANDYGGLGYEKDPACLAVGAIALELERIRAMEPVAWKHKLYGHVQGNHDFLSASAKRNYADNGQWEPLYTLGKP